ncbi:lipoprotein [Bacillus anthracis]|nr:lipoprotein [Bacillus anthracis]
MKKLSFVMLFLLVVMAGCSNYDTYIETGMQSLKDEKYSDATMWFEKAEKEKSGNEAKSYKEMAEKMDHGATALKDGKYLEAKDITNEVLQMKKDDALETAVTSNAENMLQKAKDVEKKVNERVAKRRKVEEEEGIDKLIKAVDSIDDVKEKEKKVSEALDKAEEAQAKIEAKKNK